MTLKNKPLIASKESQKFHLKFCPYAQNIKENENAIWFDQTSEAEMFGFERCKCLHNYEDVEVPTVTTVTDSDEDRLKEKFLVLQHLSEYTDPEKAVESKTMAGIA